MTDSGRSYSEIMYLTCTAKATAEPCPGKCWVPLALDMFKAGLHRVLGHLFRPWFPCQQRLNQVTPEVLPNLMFCDICEVLPVLFSFN